MIGGLGLLLMERLPQGLVEQHVFGQTLGLAIVQIAWLLIAITIVTVLAIVVRTDNGCGSTSTRGRPPGWVCCCSRSSLAGT